MKKVAIVTQRCHPSIVGGSETLAWQYANLLSDAYEVEVLTTTAIDTAEWSNTLSPGIETTNELVIRRFPVTIGRLPFWGGLHERLLRDFPVTANNGSRPVTKRWPVSLQQEFVRTQGPYSEPLFDFLRERWRDYLTIIFVTYLYPTSYFGMLQVPPGSALFVPTLHYEEPALLPIYKHAARRSRAIIWLTGAERRLGDWLWGELPGHVVGMKVETEPARAAVHTAPYLLYCGRIDPNKGCKDLFEYFMRFKADYPSDLQLLLAGKDDIPVPQHNDIHYRGFVNADEKLSLMAGATALAMPSAKESFSIVTLEAMAQQTPVLANEASAVVADHLRLSKAGELYKDYESFATKLKNLMTATDEVREMGVLGRKYVLENYRPERIQRDLIAIIESTRETGDGTRGR
jgi:glycosyltransferase involved in cell wall biosynthesis